MKYVFLFVMILLEFMIVFKRCVIVKIVYCLNFLRMVFWIRLLVLKECRNIVIVIYFILVVDILLFLLFINL